MSDWSEEDTFNRLRRKDFVDVFNEVLKQVAIDTGLPGSTLRLESYLNICQRSGRTEFEVNIRYHSIIEQGYWKVEDFLKEGQRNLDTFMQQTLS